MYLKVKGKYRNQPTLPTEPEGLDFKTFAFQFIKLFLLMQVCSEQLQF